MSNITGWSRGLEVSGGGRGVVSHAGLALLRHLADQTGLTDGLSAALATPRILVHDRVRRRADRLRRDACLAPHDPQPGSVHLPCSPLKNQGVTLLTPVTP